MRIQSVVSYNYYQPMKQPVFMAAKVKLPSKEHLNELGVFFHHIYEYKKGLRSLILTTEKNYNREFIQYKLEKEQIPYVIHNITEDKINVYFGNEDCINVVKTFNEKLNKLSPEQDFMLGIMLGYDKILQCQRYMKRLGENLLKG